jgi:ubiquinone/menaquinone biosynthesis C-methylase UbiE
MRQEQSPVEARVSQSDATALYDKLAGVYNLFGHLAESKARDRSLELADVKPGQHVLEVAVGTGLAFVHVVRANPDGRNVGIDISQGMRTFAGPTLFLPAPIGIGSVGVFFSTPP